MKCIYLFPVFYNFRLKYPVVKMVVLLTFILSFQPPSAFGTNLDNKTCCIIKHIISSMGGPKCPRSYKAINEILYTIDGTRRNVKAMRILIDDVREMTWVVGGPSTTQKLLCDIFNPALERMEGNNEDQSNRDDLNPKIDSNMASTYRALSIDSLLHTLRWNIPEQSDNEKIDRILHISSNLNELENTSQNRDKLQKMLDLLKTNKILGELFADRVLKIIHNYQILARVPVSNEYQNGTDDKKPVKLLGAVGCAPQVDTGEITNLAAAQVPVQKKIKRKATPKPNDASELIEIFEMLRLGGKQDEQCIQLVNFIDTIHSIKNTSEIRIILEEILDELCLDKNIALLEIFGDTIKEKVFQCFQTELKFIKTQRSQMKLMLKK